MNDTALVIAFAVVALGDFIGAIAMGLVTYEPRNARSLKSVATDKRREGEKA